MMVHHVLILGGTTEARELAARLSLRPDLAVTLSLAGRTANPVEHDVPVRVGGFGGHEGLAAYLTGEGVCILIDATHPFAVRMSANAGAAAETAGVPLIALRRPQWQKQAGDLWTEVGSVSEAVLALGEKPRRVFVTLGRQELMPLEAAPQHQYLIRSVDAVDPPLTLPHARYVLERGPFEERKERALLQAHAIDVILSKNSGGDAAYPKIAAARALKIPVLMVRRPLGTGVAIDTVDAALDAVSHLLPAPA